MATVSASVAVSVSMGAQSSVSARLAGLDDLVRSELARSGAPGAAVVVVSGGQIVFAKGFGLANVETREAVTPDSLFQIGSVTKPFTAAAILTDGLEGRLGINQPVSRVIKGLTPCIGRVTLGELLSHSAGLIDEPDEFGPQGEEGLAAYPRTWRSDYCLLAPGRAFSYSNSGFALAGLALQEREGKPFADLMRERVLTPLGMGRTTFRPTEAMTGPLAVGHRTQDGVVSVVRPLPNDARLWPAGTLYSSAREMGRFLLAMTQNGRVDGNQALPAAAIKEMMTPRVSTPTSGGHYGYGLFLDQYRGQQRASHAGGMTGYGAAFAVLPESNLGVAVLANGDGAILTNVGNRVLEILAEDRPAPPPPLFRRPVTPDFMPGPAQRATYAGTYTNPRRFTVDIVVDGDRLVLKRFGRDFPMRAIDMTRFAIDSPSGSPETIVIGLDNRQRADYIQMFQWALARRR